MSLIKNRKLQPQSRDSGVQTSGATQGAHGQPTFNEKINVFYKIGAAAAPHPVGEIPRANGPGRLKSSAHLLILNSILNSIFFLLFTPLLLRLLPAIDGHRSYIQSKHVVRHEPVLRLLR